MKCWRSTSVLLFVLAGSLFVTAYVASAGPKEDVGAATMKWAQTLGQNDPDKVVLLYATDGVLWGTLSPTLRADRAALRDYFVTAFKALPNLKVTFGEQLIRAYGNTAVNTGTTPSRMSRTARPTRCQCDIASHSSKRAGTG
jgi:Uncharacterized protein conserved in bacteria with a cystatin-like fold